MLLDKNQKEIIIRMLLINNPKENHYTHAVGQTIQEKASHACCRTKDLKENIKCMLIDK